MRPKRERLDNSKGEGTYWTPRRCESGVDTAYRHFLIKIINKKILMGTEKKERTIARQHDGRKRKENGAGTETGAVNTALLSKVLVRIRNENKDDNLA